MVASIVKKDFSQPASEEQIERTACTLEANGFHTLIAEDRQQARRLFFQLVPEGAQVFQGKSATLEELGITAEIEQSGRFIAVRPTLRALDKATQADQIRRLVASPDFMTGSVAAVTEDGHVLAASASGRQLGPYVSGAGQVIWVVGAQKIVENLDEGFRRIEEYALPLEDERVFKTSAHHTSLNKVVVFYKERPGRITIILVKEPLGY
jgi:L-lactate utilization protein LutC